jgi:hypothetical protein
VVALGGVVWLVAFGDIRPPKRIGIVHKELYWRDVNDFPQPFCPVHDVRLLAKTNAEPFNIYEIGGYEAVGEPASSVRLRCPAEGGHDLPLPDEEWRISDVAAEVRVLLEQVTHGHRPARLKVVR